MTGARSIVFIDRPDWHARQLAAAFAKAGVEPVLLSLRRCGFTGTPGGARLRLPSFEDELPLGAFVRSISAGSFEQVTLRLGVLHALRESGVLVYNDARAIERCVDKSMTSFLLHRAGIPTPPTFAGESDAQAAQWMASVTEDRVAKPLFGSQGRGLIRLAPGDALPPADIYAGVRYLQRFAGRDSSWRDYRVMVVGKAAAAAMLRHGKSWITNVRRGARCETVAATGDLAALSLAAVGAVGADYAGVDLIEDRSGALLVLEVNSMPAWKGLQSVASCDIASVLARYVLSRLA